MAKNMSNAAAKWVAAMQSPMTQQSYKDGVNSVTQSPTVAASTPDAEARYVSGVQQSVSSGKRAAALQAVSLQQWQQAALNKGAPRLSSGASNAQAKMQAHFAKWGPIYQQASAAAHALPKGGLGNAMARVQASIQVLMAAAGKA